MWIVSSIRNLTATIALGLACLSGCVRRSETPPAAVDRQTIPSDDAMARRDWDKSTAAYTNTAVEAGADRLRYEPRNPDHGRWLDAPLFFVNSLVLPFTYISQPANEPVQNTTGASLGSSYTAIPPAEGGSTGIAQDYGGRTPKSRVAPPNAQGSVGTGGVSAPARGGGGTNIGTGSGAGTSGK
jgi:hypothetical protein